MNGMCVVCYVAEEVCYVSVVCELLVGWCDCRFGVFDMHGVFDVVETIAVVGALDVCDACDVCVICLLVMMCLVCLICLMCDVSDAVYMFDMWDRRSLA